jgi:3'(2'), 5'-bisphosphate nucleotidase
MLQIVELPAEPEEHQVDVAGLWSALAAELPPLLAGYRSRLAAADLPIGRKADNSVLTDADLVAEDLILTAIRAADPGAHVLAEESGASFEGGPVPDEYWVVDPIDGTAQFIDPARTEFCNVICHVRDGYPTHALVIAPEWSPDGPLVLTASVPDTQLTINGMPAAPTTALPPSHQVSVIRWVGLPPRTYERTLAEAGYTPKVRGTSSTLDLVRTAVDLTGHVPEPSRFDLFYRRGVKFWDSIPGLCFAAAAGLPTPDLPIPPAVPADPKPLMPSTLTGRPETVAWFRDALLAAEPNP